MEDEIDLGKYLQVLLKHWKIIVGITLAAVVISAGVTLLTPPVYEARATVLCTGDAKTLLGLAKSQAVAAGAAERLAGKLDANECRTGALLGAVSAAARDNLIDITARSTNPQKAADIANAWSEAYINYATDYYKTLQSSPDELKIQVAAALAVYNERNEALVKFQEQVRKNDTGNCLACAELLYDVQGLRREIETTADRAPHNALSRVFYQCQAKAYSIMIPGAQGSGIQWSSAVTQPSTQEVQVTLADVDYLIKMWSSAVTQPSTGEMQVTLADVDYLINMLEKGAGISGQTPDVLLHTISDMKLKKAAETITLDDLTYARDTARNSYIEAAKQAMNADLARQSHKQQLRSIEIAVPVDTPVTGIKWVNIGIAFVLGLIAGVIAAFALEYFQKKRPAKGEIA